MSSVELPDDNDKSSTASSTSPSPITHHQPQNLYVVLFNFKPRHNDELELKAGYKLALIDATDKDWWIGNCKGFVGIFPSSYVAKLAPGEKPLQVIQSLQIRSTVDGVIKLLRDQIVMRIRDGVRDGSVLIRTASHHQGLCPVHYLQKV